MLKNTMSNQYPVLEGYEVVTRDGRKVEQLHKFETANFVKALAILGILKN